MLILDTPRLEFRRARAVVERTRELTDAALIKNLEANSWITAPDNGVDVTHANAQLGQVLSRSAFEGKLRRCNGRFTFETSIADPSKAGVYCETPLHENLPVAERKRFICGFENGWLPEFSIRHTSTERRAVAGGGWEDYREFSHETRGWRTVLVILLKQRLITIAYVHREFPTCRRDSRTWGEATR